MNLGAPLTNTYNSNFLKMSELQLINLTLLPVHPDRSDESVKKLSVNIQGGRAMINYYIKINFKNVVMRKKLKFI